jgi:hypothetical protein
VITLHKYFRLKGIEPGRVVTRQFGTIDFREKISLATLRQLHAAGFPYLELTKEGERRLTPKNTS